MQIHEVSRTAILAAVLVFAQDDAWAFDEVQEQKSLDALTQQVHIACAAKGPSAARVSLSVGVVQRINARMNNLSQEIQQQSEILDHFNFPRQAVAAQLDQAIAAAQANVKSMQWEYTTAVMYRQYSTGNVRKAQRALTQAQASLAALQDAKNGPSRSLASLTAGAAADSLRDNATADLASLADFHDRYQGLRSQTTYCSGMAAGNPGTKMLSIDPTQNFPGDGDTPIAAGTTGAAGGRAAP